MQIPGFNYCSGQVSWSGVFPRETALALAELCSPPLLFSILHLRCFLILFWSKSLKSKDFPLVCFALLGQGLLLQSLLLRGNLNGVFPSYCKNPGKESVCVEGNLERERKSCCVMQKNFLASFNCLLRLEFAAFIFSSQAGGRNNFFPWLCQ